MKKSKIDDMATVGNATRPESKTAIHSHRQKAIEAASFVVVGYGLSQIIRLASNIILTRLLAPEFFGLIALANVFIAGLYLFSDVGVSPAIIRSQRTDDPAFLNTAWTIQVIRSLILAAFSCALAFPVAAYYQEPMLNALIPVIGLASIPGGFVSTSLTKLERELQQKQLMIMELVIQIICIICTIIAAYFMRNVWALLISPILGTLIRLIWSHSINKYHPNKFHFEKEAAKEILDFGKWILASTAITFLATQSDRMLLGKLFSMKMLGVYNIAVTLAEVPKQVLGQLNGKVLFPLIAKFAHFPRAELREKIRAPRGKLLVAAALLLAILSCFGDVLVKILYDQRYSEGTWILPLLAVGMWPFLLVSSIDPSLLAIGKTKYSAFGNLAKFIFMVVFIPLAYRLGGELGAVLVVALNDIPSYIVLNYGLAKEKLSLMRQDAWTTLVFLAAIGVLLLIRVLTGMGLPGQAVLGLRL